MKKGIHPEQKSVKFVCHCGNTFEAMSTIDKDTYNVEVCSACHPQYTGKASSANRSTKIEKFNSKYNRESK